MAKNLDDDEYVAELLKQDAKSATKKYELVGIDAFNPRRANSSAPKPNKNFLRNIIRQTDRHNAALLAKEAEESRARLRTMNRERKRREIHHEEEQEKRAPGRLTPVPGDDDFTKAHSDRRRDHSESRDRHRRRRRSKEREPSKNTSPHRHRDRKRHKRRYDSDDERDSSRQKRRRSRSPRDKAHGHKGSDSDDDRRSRRRDREERRHRRRRSYSGATSQSRSPPPRHYDRHEKRRKHRGYSSRDTEKNSEPRSDRENDRPSSKRRATSPASDSDPLEAIVGPLPPSSEPTVRSKGRGAFKPNSMGIESRFSSTYDPKVDVRADSDNEDDWGDALEALRDRARWKQQGAERLKSAGFTDEQVRKWERGEGQNEKDVVWKGKGEAREWDRGKVLDEDGDVELKADFGRLK
ncbi:hypothetical protein COCC4DRAFT_126260 [Bipolaris maydis ATCC 48331]|uniref:Pre-mRNA-splicing factor 38B n=2 Tax=Cochliobolus heterostrophus TaxID=5016 RepID=M2SWY6_COCH5|nr:uncharacterized protein COCC4DRAFT_126260 [Bipolaris maydis ATCC 48331]EMD89855.1 hypothetical protein COCHEDRAFT_1156886 [Bipolaris maydis C5]KAH7563291.1 hypothetical protein BM1_00338 [Bipolaris maydis]ENI09932.1 hypothetical protein COCC4DRAFT_126260 [Bipolaris maydis ATCC 48331]KAJ5025451.1 hypothetical protein J3E73DRAFT_49685 [Bipolaris maydis]KAJ5064051.1 hypothetical protein J3E74DRAFT_24020 [Bipolaris maydis]